MRFYSGVGRLGLLQSTLSAYREAQAVRDSTYSPLIIGSSAAVRAALKCYQGRLLEDRDAHERVSFASSISARICRQLQEDIDELRRQLKP